MYTYWYIQHELVYNKCTITYYKYWHNNITLHVLAYTTCTGIYYMYWHVLHVLLYTTCTGIYYMYWHILHVLVYTTCTGIVHVMFCAFLDNDLLVKVLLSFLLASFKNLITGQIHILTTVIGRVCSHEISSISSWGAVSVIHCIHRCTYTGETITCV